MDDIEIRLACLGLAIKLLSTTPEVIETAAKFYEFAYGNHPSAPPFPADLNDEIPF